MITVKRGKFTEFLNNGDPHLKGAVAVKRLVDDAKRDFPNRNEKRFFKRKMMIPTESDLYYVYPMFQPDVYARAVDLWYERWFGNEMS